MNLNKWHDDLKHYRSQYQIDKRFKRRIIKLGPYAMWESIRILQKDINDKPSFRYHRAVGIREKSMEPEAPGYKIYRKIYYLLNKIFRKEIEVDNIKTSVKYLDKYPFVADLFKDVKRAKILEELGI
jgi:hypothetical protein